MKLRFYSSFGFYSHLLSNGTVCEILTQLAMQGVTIKEFTPKATEAKEATTLQEEEGEDLFYNEELFSEGDEDWP
jgi:hypothetical protein